ncbi:carbohydrate ABC transporter permease [Ruania alba]|uniref:carbohydrate ABC transporter permease n=1 Tax=Ruania alba TaxID=648782 RepID=UPI00158709AB|nr:sugar ABC transporter permease [Ruania alba]
MLAGAIVIGVFHVGAIIFDVVMSFTDWSLAGATFNYGQNYADLIASAEFVNALAVTLFYVLGTVPVTLALAMPIAYLMHTTLARYSIYRILVFTPYVVPTVAGALIFQTVFGPTPGSLANALLGIFGAEPRTWLLDGNGLFAILLDPLGVQLSGLWAGPSVALMVVTVVQVWNLLGFTVVVLLGALSNVDPSMFEAARIDGAGGVRLFRNIAMPLVKPTLLFLSVALTVFTMREFNLPYVLAGGGPFGSTETLSLMMVRQFWEDNQLGMGATTAIVLALLIVGLSWVQFKVSKGEQYD